MRALAWFVGAAPAVNIACLAIVLAEGERHQMTLWNWAIVAATAIGGGLPTVYLYSKIVAWRIRP